MKTSNIMSKEIKPKRRDFLFTATYTIGVVGLGAAIWPLVDQMNPDSSVKALSTTEVDISSVEPGKKQEGFFVELFSYKIWNAFSET